MKQIFQTIKKLPLVLFVLIFCGCSSTDYYTVASEYGYTCDGESNMTIRQHYIKTDTSDKWEMVDLIEGMPYERGYEYTIKVKKDKDVSWQFTYEGIVSKVKKDSEGLRKEWLYDESWGNGIDCNLLIGKSENSKE
jgi:hypothetical protein